MSLSGLLENKVVKSNYFGEDLAIFKKFKDRNIFRINLEVQTFKS